MPILDGYAATEYIKAQAHIHETVIVALTASAFDSEQEMVLAKGCDGFLRKPVTEAEIWATLTQHLGVAFIFEDAIALESPATMSATEQGDRLSKMPSTWRKAFKKAAIIAKPEAVIALIQQLPDTEQPLAAQLAQMVAAYRFADLVNLIEVDPE